MVIVCIFVSRKQVKPKKNFPRTITKVIVIKKFIYGCATPCMFVRQELLIKSKHETVLAFQNFVRTLHL